jgi:SAM-dependent methyltransferase
MPACPVCAAGAVSLHLRTSVDEAANGYARDASDIVAMQRILRRLWGRESAEVYTCEVCGFGFADPQIAGDAEFYTLAYGESPVYPPARWEFGRTLSALAEIRTGRLLEIGAGDGQFLVAARDAGWDCAGVELGEAAAEALRQQGLTVHEDPLDALIEEVGIASRDVICMFQTLEHLADPHRVFDILSALLAGGGHLFVSVPNAAHVLAQEELTGVLDLPPNHVGRWTPRALEIMGSRHALAAVVEADPAERTEIAAHLAHYHRMQHGSAVDRLPQWARGPANAVDLTVRARWIRRRRNLPAPTLWAHLAKAGDAR